MDKQDKKHGMKLRSYHFDKERTTTFFSESGTKPLLLHDKLCKGK